MEKRLINYLASFILMTISYSQNLDQVKLANEYYLSKDYEKAADIYKKLSKQKKNLQQIHTNYLNLMINNRMYDNAFNYTKSVIKTFPNVSRYWVDHIYVASLLPNQKEYKRLKEELVNFYFQNPNVLKKISEEFAFRKMHNDALMFLTYARTQSKDPYIYSLDFAKVYSVLGNLTKMMIEYINFASQQPRHIDYVKSILQELVLEKENQNILENQLIDNIQKNPDNLLYNDLLMWLYIQKKDYKSAFIQAKAIDRKSKNKNLSVMQVANVAYDNQSYYDAIKFYNYITVESDNLRIKEKAKFLSLLSQEKIAINGLSTNKNTLIEVSDAYQNFYEGTSRSNPDRYDALRNKSRLLAYHLNQPDSAIKILKTLKNLSGMDKKLLAHVKMDLANVNMIVGKHWEASLLYSQIEKENNYMSIGYEAKLENARLHYFMNNFNLAKAHLDILKRSTTKTIANDALELSLFIETNTIGDSNELALKQYANISLLMYQNKFDEARNKLKFLIDSQLYHPIRDDCFWLLVKLEKYLGKYDEAINLLNILIREYSDGVLGDDALFMKAQILEKHLNNASKAKEIYQQFLGDFPGSAYAVEARKRYRLLNMNID